MSESQHEPRESFLLANGLRHRVLTWNEGGSDTLVCAHGFLDHAWSFDFLARALMSRGLRVVAFDWRGHGGSDRVGAGGYYHFADYVLDLEELAPQLCGGEPFHLLGHSMGGTATSMWAGSRPALLRSLTVCEGLGPPEVPYDDAPRRLRGWLDSIARVRSRDAKPLRDIDDAAARLRSQHAELDEIKARFLAEKGTREIEGGGRQWCFDALHRTPSALPFRPEILMELLKAIEVPTLVVTGEKGFRTADHAARVACLRDAREVELAGATHMMHWYQPELLAQHVAAHVGV